MGTQQEMNVVISFSKEEIEKIRESSRMRNMAVEDYVRIYALLNAKHYTTCVFNQ